MLFILKPFNSFDLEVCDNELWLGYRLASLFSTCRIVLIALSVSAIVSFSVSHSVYHRCCLKLVTGGEPRLRGCIGTLEACQLINGFRDYALTSALRAHIQAKELPYLECTVSGFYSDCL
ncbi:hypothetical protein V6N13_028607 [Hibiscus sabdariffa]|uniref:AMMECR1 domain-containing protein n=1 Tax=Hibiscus sabdariffa TaxID=183260 RepID=A0ABR2P9H8_9ROSI